LYSVDSMDLQSGGSSSAIRVALILTAVHLLLSVIWLSQNDLPNGARDEFFIVEVATDVAFRLGKPEAESIRPYLFENAYYPPLVRLPAIFALWCGGSYRALVLSGWLWLPFLLIPTWIIGREISGTPWGGTGALAILLASPGLTNSLHHYESNLGPMAMGACCFLMWVRSAHLSSHRHSLALGVFLGLGLLSDRLGVLPFLVLPLVVSCALGRSRKSLQGFGLVLLGAVVTGGWWYLGFLQRFGGELIPQFLQGEIDRGGTLTEVSSSWIGWWAHYLLLWPDNQLGLIAGVLALCGLLLGCLRLHRGGAVQTGLLIWTLGGLALFTLSAKRQVYYTLPLIPHASVLASVTLGVFVRRTGRAGKSAAVLAIFLISLPAFLSAVPGQVDLSRGLGSWLLVHQSPLPASFLGERHELARVPERSGLDLESAIQELKDATGKEMPVVAAFSADSAQVTEHYQIVLGRIAMGGLGVHGLTTHPEGFIAGTHPPSALFFVHRGGDSWPDRDRLMAAHNEHDRWKPEFEQLAEQLASWRSGASLLATQQLADGEQLSIWRLER